MPALLSVAGKLIEKHLGTILLLSNKNTISNVCIHGDFSICSAILVCGVAIRGRYIYYLFNSNACIS